MTGFGGSDKRTPGADPRGAAKSGYLAAILGALALVIIVTSLVTFRFERQGLREHVRTDLAHIANFKARQLSNWINSRQDDAYAVGRNFFFGETVARWLQSGAPADVSAGRIEAYLAELITAHDYEGIILFDRAGKARLAIGPNTNVYPQDEEIASETVENGLIRRSDLHVSDDEVAFEIVAPLFAAQGSAYGTVAAVMFRLNAAALVFPLVREWPEPSATAEVLLVRRDGESVLYLTGQRGRSDGGQKLRLPVERDDLPAAMAVRGQEGEVEGVDYRGVQVVAALRAVAGTPWHLVAKIDAEEAHAPIRELARRIAWTAALVFLGLGAITAYWWRAERLRRLAREMQLQIERQALVRHFDYLTKFANDVIVLTDGDGRIVEANDRAISSYGYAREELLRLHGRDLGTSDSRQLADELAKEVGLAGTVFEAVHVRKDGSTFPVEVSARAIEIEGRRFMQGIIRDISERKRAEQSVLEHFKFAEAVFHHSINCLAILDRDFNFIRVNPAYAAASRRDIREFPGRNHFEMYPSDAKLIFDNVLRTKYPYRIAGRPFTYADQPERGVTYWDWTLVPVLDQQGEVEYLIFSLYEVTERKRAELSLQRVNRALKTLSSCNEALVRAADESQLLQSMCRNIVEIGGYRLAWVGFAEDDTQKTVRPAAHAGYAEGYMERASVTWADTEQGRGPVGTAIRTQKPQVVQNAHTDPGFKPWRENAARLGYGALLALPLTSESRTLGALSIYSSETDAFDEEEIHLLGELANDLAYGVSSLRMRSANQRNAERLRHSMEATVTAVAATVEMRDPYTAGHQRRVAELAVAIARELGLPQDQIQGIQFAAIVHDLGKVKVPAEILSKPGRLSDLEYQIIKTHSQAGYDILKGIDFPWPIAEMVLQHHERLDGSGYPQGLKDAQIGIGARILGVADTVEAMSSHRPYRPGLGIQAALEEIEKNRGKCFDPAAVDACARLFREQNFAFSG